MTTTAQIGIIGGSGLYQMEGMSEVEEVQVETPFGPPSDALVVGNLSGVRVAFLPRHGRGHRISPTELPVRANIYALKSLGVQRVISISAVGSLREEIRPLDLVIPDQLIDRTRGRVSTFFGGGIVVHAAFADPFCPDLSQILHSTGQAVGARMHLGGTYVVMEGPLFSTRAESNLYRSWGASVIGMTGLPEAKLCREAELCYATLACATDYDCWHESEETVSVDVIVANLLRNVATSQEIIRRAVVLAAQSRPCGCGSSLANAIITTPSLIPAGVKRDLRLLIGKYVR